MKRTSRRGLVRRDGRAVGILDELSTGYRFTYLPEYLADPRSAAVSLTLPKRRQPHESQHLFGFFVGLLAEGALAEIQCRLLKLDPSDEFGRLIATAGHDTIGAVTVCPLEEETASP